MNPLIQAMLAAFANNFTYYLKSHNFHWIVMGPNFPQYHEFLQNIYEDAQGSIDDYAEQLRRLGAFPQGDYRDIVGNSMLMDPPADSTDPMVMFQALLADSEVIVAHLQDTFDLATPAREYGLQNFLADRIDAHRKQQWMINAILSTAAPAIETTATFNLASCPLALQDAELNIANHLTTIAEHGLGPADPRKPETVFWMRKADIWGVSEQQARTQLCSNCSHYISTTPMMDCITNSPGGQIKASALPMDPKWADIPGSPSGFCNLYDITCTATRTCDSWEAGGPIDDAKAQQLGMDPLGA
jgi:starvation-inducible DNA-binding protein